MKLNERQADVELSRFFFFACYVKEISIIHEHCT